MTRCMEYRTRARDIVEMKISGPLSTGLRIFSYLSIFLLGLRAFQITVSPSPLGMIFIYFVVFLITPGDIIALLLSRCSPSNMAIIHDALSPFYAAFCWAVLGYLIRGIIRKRKRTGLATNGARPEP